MWNIKAFLPMGEHPQGFILYTPDGSLFDGSLKTARISWRRATSNL